MERTHSLLFRIVGALIASAMFFLPHALFAATVYDFNADTVGAAPANTTATGGTLQVVNDGTLGKSLTSVTQNGFISGLLFDQFASSTDYVVSWKQAYSSSNGAGGMILRAQSGSMTYSGHTDARLGYLFQINGSTAYIWRTNLGGFTSLASVSFTKATPQYYKAVAQGTNLGFYYSNDGSNYTLFASSTDSTYSAGLTQYTAGYGNGMGIDTIDDVTYTNLAGDTTAPTISSLSPLDDSTATSTISTLRIGFSENVNVGSGNILIKKTNGDTLVESIPVGSGQITGGGTATITITPSTSLSYNTGYYVQIPNTAFTDLASNAFAGISNTTTWNFTTMDGGGGSGLTVRTPQAPTLSLGGTTGTTAKILFTTNNQGISLSGVGFEYGKKDTNKQKIELSYAPQSWTYQLAGLACATTYYLRGYVLNSLGTIYSDPLSFTTNVCRTTVTPPTPKKITLTASVPEKIGVASARDLKVGDKGTDVASLQTLLVAADTGTAARELARVGASGYFSTYTQKALREYQKTYAIKPAAGYFGSTTRAYMKSKGLSVWW